MSKLEDKLQASQVTWFKNTRQPGLLWTNDNNSVHPMEALKKRAKGMSKGAPDLNFFNGTLYGIENKILGTSHNRIHLLEQIEFGKTIELLGGHFYFCFSLEEFQKIISGNYPKTITHYWIKKINYCKTEIFKF